MESNKSKQFSESVSVLDQFNVTGVPTGNPESSQHSAMYASKSSIHNSVMDPRFTPIPYTASAPSTSYDLHAYNHPKVTSSLITPSPDQITHSWNCNICHKPYKTLAGLDKHVRSNHQQVMSSANFEAASTAPPPKSSSESNQLGDRNKADRKNKSSLCACTVCGNEFPYQSKLIDHMKVHTGEKPFRCEYENCGKGFCRKDKLTRHTFIHTGERPFGCSRCDKKFYRKDKLTRHERTHDTDPHNKNLKVKNTSTSTSSNITVKQEISASTSSAPTMMSSHYEEQQQSRNDILPPKQTNLISPQDPIGCRFCGAQFTDRPTFDHHLLLHATFLGSKMPEPVKFYGSVPGT